LFDDWAKRVSEEKALGGKHLVDRRGMLQIEWPSMADGSGDVPLDLILATSNNPKPRKQSDLSVGAIADAWRAKGDSYFRCNRANGIYTFQDRELEELLHRHL
jgi:hypothetical protein